MAHILYNQAYQPNVRHLDGASPEAAFPAIPIFNTTHRRPCREVRISEIIDDFIRRQDLDSLVILVPTARRVRMVQQEIVRSMHAIHGLPCEEPRVFTLERFVQYCYKKICNTRRRRELSEAYRLALFEEALEKADLKFFSRGGGKVSPATLERLANIVWGLKEDGITPANLRDDIALAGRGELEADVMRLGDIAALYEKYQELLGKKFLDPPELLNMTTDALLGVVDPGTLENVPGKQVKMDEICERIRTIFPGTALIFAEGFSEFKEPELKFLSIFTNCTVPFAIRIDYSEKNGPLFGNMRETVENLRSVGYGDCCLDDPKPLPVPHPDERVSIPLGAYLRRWLFNSEREIRHPDFSKVGKIIAAENRAEEVRAISKLIRKLSEDDGIPLSEICVVMRQSERYTGLFREMFALYSIPSNITDRFPLSKSPVVIAVFAVLDLALRGFRREDLHRALQSPYLSFRGPDGELLDGANMYDTALRLRIAGGDRRGGREAWLRRMTGALESYERRLALMQSDPFADAMELDALRADADSTRRAIADFEALGGIVPANARMSAAEFSVLVKEKILRDLGVRESILEFHARIGRYLDESALDYVRLQEEVEKDARAYSALIRLLDEMCFIYDERGQGKEKNLEEFAQRLRTAVTASRYQVREKSGLGVTVTSVEQTRGTPFRAMILCGAVDGEFPMAYTPETFLGKELPETETRFVQAERLQFYSFLTNNIEALEKKEKLLFITYPKYSEGGNEIIRSPFVDALLKVTNLEFDECVFDGHELSLLPKTDTGAGAAEFMRWYTALGSGEELLAAVGASRRWELENGSVSRLAAAIEAIPSADAFAGAVSFVKDQVVRRTGAREQDGVVHKEALPDDAREFLERMPARTFSVTELEKFAKCGYQYFAGKILGMSEREPSDNALSPLERGTLFHAILYRFYMSVQKAQIASGESEIIARPKRENLPPLAPVHLHDGKYKEYLSELFALAEEEMARISYEHPFFDLEKEELMGAAGKTGRLELWLKEELRRAREWGARPVLFELGFGPEDVPDGELRLRGRIDRIEFFEYSEGSWGFFITDYKSTGASVPSNPDLVKGVAFQVPLYLAAAKDFLEKNYGLVAVPAGGIYQILAPVFDRKKKKYDADKHFMVPKSIAHIVGAEARYMRNAPADEAELDMKLGEVSRLALDAVHTMADGFFPAQPYKPEHCGYCAYSGVCRIKERAVDEENSAGDRTEG